MHAVMASHPAALSWHRRNFEKEVLTVAVPAMQADATFELIYGLADINRPHGGLMYMHPLLMATPYTLPELPEEQV